MKRKAFTKNSSFAAFGISAYRFYGIIALIGYRIVLCVNYYEETTIMNSNLSLLGFPKSYLT